MGSALVVIDMLNTYAFEDADDLVASAREAVPNIRRLLDRALEEDVPVIYVNDNYGDWNSSAEELLQHGLEGRQPDLVEPLRPPDEASFGLPLDQRADFDWSGGDETAVVAAPFTAARTWLWPQLRHTLEAFSR